MKPTFDDHALVRHAELRRLVRDERRDQHQRAEQQDGEARAGHLVEGDENHDPHDQHEDCPGEDDPVQRGPIDDALVREQRLVDIAHCSGVGTPTAHR
jgi:hypothetical protein